MTGELGLGNKTQPKFQHVYAHQILVAPLGFIWQLQPGKAKSTLSGSDGFYNGQAWLKFWLLKLIPVARISGGHDLARSAFDSMIAEAAVWSPAKILPQFGATWKALSYNQVRVTIKSGAFIQDIDIDIADDGKPTKVSLLRWSDANPDNKYTLQPFGAHLSKFEWFEGFQVATHIDAGNFIDTPDYFLFYKVEVRSIHYR